jgi:predicted DNA-binding transcriptional regulator AlpA
MTEHNIAPTFLRLKQIIGDDQSDPPVAPIIPISKSAWWKGVKDGLYPSPIKLSSNVTVWRSDEIQALIDNLCTKSGTQDAA